MENSGPPVLALDFDGVICDSVDECILTATNAYYRFEGNPAWSDDLSKLSVEYVTRFRRLRYLVRPAREYWLLVYWLNTQAGDLDQTQFDALKREYTDTLVKFETVFFETRDELRKANPARWFAWHRLFPEFIIGWEELRGRCSAYIVTTKDLRSVQSFNELWNLGLERDRLWTREGSCSKPSAIVQIARLEGCAAADIAFVDDHPEHLREVSATGARCYWAAWGYTKKNEAVNNFRRLDSLLDLVAQWTSVHST